MEECKSFQALKTPDSAVKTRNNLLDGADNTVIRSAEYGRLPVSVYRDDYPRPADAREVLNGSGNPARYVEFRGDTFACLSNISTFGPCNISHVQFVMVQPFNSSAFKQSTPFFNIARLDRDNVPFVQHFNLSFEWPCFILYVSAFQQCF